MPVLSQLTTANTVIQMMSKVNDVISNFQNYDNASEIVFTPIAGITANNVTMAIIQTKIAANTATNLVTSQLTSNVATLNIRINTVEEQALATAVALSIALG